MESGTIVMSFVASALGAGVGVGVLKKVIEGGVKHSFDRMLVSLERRWESRLARETAQLQVWAKRQEEALKILGGRLEVFREVAESAYRAKKLVGASVPNQDSIGRELSVLENLFFQYRVFFPDEADRRIHDFKEQLARAEEAARTGAIPESFRQSVDAAFDKLLTEVKKLSMSSTFAGAGGILDGLGGVAVQPT